MENMEDVIKYLVSKSTCIDNPSRKTLASDLEITEAMLSKIFKGKKTLSENLLNKIKTKLNITENYFNIIKEINQKTKEKEAINKSILKSKFVYLPENESWLNYENGTYPGSFRIHPEMKDINYGAYITPIKIMSNPTRDTEEYVFWTLPVSFVIFVNDERVSSSIFRPGDLVGINDLKQQYSDEMIINHSFLSPISNLFYIRIKSKDCCIYRISYLYKIKYSKAINDYIFTEDESFSHYRLKETKNGQYLLFNKDDIEILGTVVNKLTKEVD
jgi:transcriptional regulator with XRE-family HTH domain